MAELKFEGIYPASLTPMHADYSCNEEELGRHCQDLLQRGCSGVVLFGTTGEGTAFSVDERIKIIKGVIRFGINPNQLIIGVSSTSIVDAVKLVDAAMKSGCSAVLVLPPFYYKNVSDEGVIAFYRYLVQQVSNVKMLLYHIPQFSGVPITLNVIRTLRQEFPEQIVGIKESEGNLPLTKEILLQIPDFSVLVGHELQVIEAVRMGAAGSIGGFSNAFPELVYSLYACGKDNQKPDRNQTLYEIAQIVKKYPLFPALKQLVEIQKGKSWHVMRPPLIPLSFEQAQELLNELDKVNREL